MATLERQIASGYDDACERCDSFYFNSAAAWLASSASTSGSNYISGLRFQNVTIPAGAVILSATVTVFTIDGYREANADVLCQAADNPGSFFDHPAVAVRTPTAASVPWVDPSLYGEAESPDFATVLQEVIDRPGWVEGNAVVVLIRGRTDADAGMWCRSYDYNSESSAILNVTFGPLVSVDGDWAGQVPLAAGGAAHAIAGAAAVPGQLPVVASLGTVAHRYADGATFGQLPIVAADAEVVIAAAGQVPGQVPVVAALGLSAFEVTAAGGTPGQVPAVAADATLYPRYHLDARGVWRIFNETEYRFYWGAAIPEETDSPQETSATLPYTTTDTFDGTITRYFSASWFNGALDSGFLPLGPNGETYLRLDLVDGVEVGNPPQPPNEWRLEAKGAGVVRVWGLYYELGDNRAATWAIAYTTDGSDPPADTPDVTQAMPAGGLAILQYDLPATADATTVKVRLQTYRSGDTTYSENSTIETITSDAAGPTAPLDAERWPGGLPEE